ncbi:MAG: CBS domain-containing protein [Trueperaceae bacterium]|nr:CBS domain-containing protein [Trueperaceae bacterium]
MLVKDIMTKKVVAIDPDMPIGDVNTLMEERNIRHFPILASGELVGIVSDRDIRLVGSEHPKSPRGISLKDAVSTIMISPVLTAHPLDAIEEAAKVLEENKIGAMPVLEEDELIGIVTGIDFLKALVRLTGVYGSTSRIEVELPNDRDSLAKLVAAVSAQGVAVSSILMQHCADDCSSFSLRVSTINNRALAEALREQGFMVVWPELKF